MLDYSIYKRKVNNKSYYYVMFKNDETGKFMSAKSVESLRKRLGDTEHHHITRRSEAESIARRAREAGLDGNEKIEDPLFIDWLLQFWDFDNSYYIKKENKKRQKLNCICRDDYLYPVDAINVMTATRSKGREFDCVVILDAIEQLWPCPNPNDEPINEEEERRLFYVALTRTKKELCITVPKYYGNQATTPSKYISELRV